MSGFEHAPNVDEGPGLEKGSLAEIEKMSFEQAVAELEGIVQKLERGQLDLEASIQAYERGTNLRRHCDDKLAHARLRVEKLTFGRDGEAKFEPFEDA